jgi:hypothetical protein
VGVKSGLIAEMHNGKGKIHSSVFAAVLTFVLAKRVLAEFEYQRITAVKFDFKFPSTFDFYTMPHQT